MLNSQTTLVVGASGATGRLLVEQLLLREQTVRAIVRSKNTLPETLRDHPRLALIEASILELSDSEMVQHTQNCQAVVSCLGHNLTVKGIFGHPRRLVTDATRRLCSAITRNQSEMSKKYILMNTTGNRNRDLDESVSFAQSCLIWLLRHLLPPHADNEEAADYLRTEIGQNDSTIEWVAVRPDALINDDVVSAYELHPSPTRSAIFDSGQTSRINVAHFINDLVTDEAVWNKWKGQMPVIYNKQ